MCIRDRYITYGKWVSGVYSWKCTTPWKAENNNFLQNFIKEFYRIFYLKEREINHCSSFINLAITVRRKLSKKNIKQIFSHPHEKKH